MADEITIGPLHFEIDRRSNFVGVDAGETIMGTFECGEDDWDAFVAAASGVPEPKDGEVVVVMTKGEARGVRVASMLGEPPAPKEGEEHNRPSYDDLKSGQRKLGEAENRA